MRYIFVVKSSKDKKLIFTNFTNLLDNVPLDSFMSELTVKNKAHIAPDKLKSKRRDAMKENLNTLKKTGVKLVSLGGRKDPAWVIFKILEIDLINYL